MAKYIQSGVECFSLPEVYYLGCRHAVPGVLIHRYDRMSLPYFDNQGYRRYWEPDFIERHNGVEEIVEVKGHASVDEVVAHEIRAYGESTFREKIRAHPHVRLINGDAYRHDYFSLVRDRQIHGYREL